MVFFDKSDPLFFRPHSFIPCFRKASDDEIEVVPCFPIEARRCRSSAPSCYGIQFTNGDRFSGSPFLRRFFFPITRQITPVLISICLLRCDRFSGSPLLRRFLFPISRRITPVLIPICLLRWVIGSPLRVVTWPSVVIRGEKRVFVVVILKLPMFLRSPLRCPPCCSCILSSESVV